MSIENKFQPWNGKQKTIQIVISGLIIITIGPILLYFFGEYFGGFMNFGILVAMGMSLGIPIKIFSPHQRKLIITLEEFIDLYNQYPSIEYHEKPKKFKIIFNLVLIFLGGIAILVVPLVLVINNVFQIHIILISILYCLGEIGIGYITFYEKEPEKRKIGTIFIHNIEQTILTAELIKKYYDPEKIRIEITITERESMIQMGPTNILVNPAKYPAMEIKLICATSFGGVGLELDTWIKNGHLSKKKYNKEVDIELEFKPYVQYKPSMIIVTYVPKNGLEVRELTENEWKGIIDLYFSILESNIMK
ncbi:hypothetical protein DSAG12_03853 [Promethearchaeum syntrophicum]|uniref:Uncharacterized protein n=1 Tax=Promethearchaeum syntrophicum TaxID=2594042 RepID=A0A5B9DG38_9ARCH|nr:hypothetical protein [Candidatus Prometheoarchaeum syntrophicum]QEE18015.1 hypothetical protein DSAG12_03853 [Candidatus Prometheoarchaeum syntrophicum]